MAERRFKKRFNSWNQKQHIFETKNTRVFVEILDKNNIKSTYPDKEIRQKNITYKYLKLPKEKINKNNIITLSEFLEFPEEKINITNTISLSELPKGKI